MSTGQLHTNDKYNLRFVFIYVLGWIYWNSCWQTVHMNNLSTSPDEVINIMAYLHKYFYIPT